MRILRVTLFPTSIHPLSLWITFVFHHTVPWLFACARSCETSPGCASACAPPAPVALRQEAGEVSVPDVSSIQRCDLMLGEAQDRGLAVPISSAKLTWRLFWWGCRPTQWQARDFWSDKRVDFWTASRTNRSETFPFSGGFHDAIPLSTARRENCQRIIILWCLQDHATIYNGGGKWDVARGTIDRNHYRNNRNHSPFYCSFMSNNSLHFGTATCLPSISLPLPERAIKRSRHNRQTHVRL